jgi:altronate dehydratase small subunit
MRSERRLEDHAIVLNDADNVATALVDMPAGAYAWEAPGGARRTLRLAEPVRAGFKVALAAIEAGQEVRKYGHAIGTASADIRQGECVHVHNLRSSV